MKQGLRLVVRPGAFFNQLQWSTHHWLIMLAFLVIASIETHVGRQHLYFQVYAEMLTARFGLSYNMAIWVVTSVKMALMVAGTFALATAIWIVGNIFGRRTSKRVLFRRMAVVFTVLLAGYTANHLVNVYPVASIASIALYLWGVVLGYFAIREQFALNHVETIVIGAFALLMVSTSWHYSNQYMETTAKRHMVEVGKRPGSAPRLQQAR